METIDKMIIQVGDKEYEFAGGGGQPGPDTVGTSEIIDGSVQTEDLSDEVKEDMITQSDRVTQEELDNFNV